MTIHKALSIVVFLVVGSMLIAQTPYARIVYAEGRQFSVIRAGTPVTYNVDNPDVFGLPIERGDILQTAPGTQLEIKIHPISASVQIAENTSFRCDADESGMKSTGDLYYGRVRAKVATLSRSSSYRISSPALVAGVRGTDFGLDHILYRAPAPAGAREAPPVSSILSRVFCFDGSVLVGPVADPDLKHVVVGSGEMIETSTTTVSAAVKIPLKLEIEPVSLEVTEFWKGWQFINEKEMEPSEQVLATIDTLTKEEAQIIKEEQKRVRNHKMRIGGSIALFLGGVLITGLAYPEYKDEGFTSSVMANVGFGGVLIGSSLVLLIYDLVKH